MNLEDLILDGVIREDEYTGKVFGTLTVLGNNGQKGNHKKLIVTCSVCSSDKELFGNGYFSIHKGHFDNGCKPCGCSKKANWSEEQYRIRAKRTCELKGIIFKGWDNSFVNSNKTLVLVECQDHGEYKIPLSVLLDNTKERGCSECFKVRIGNVKRLDDSVHIHKFMLTGGFSEGSVFTRSDRVDKHGHKRYWYLYCPDCNSEGESHVGSLLAGFRSCQCIASGPKETYINLIKDGENIIALKFGVSVNSTIRLLTQNFKSVFTVENYGVWTYPDTVTCRSAERDCLRLLKTCVLSKYEMPDGYTETTYSYNLQKIIDIYRNNGGVVKSL